VAVTALKLKKKKKLFNNSTNITHTAANSHSHIEDTKKAGSSPHAHQICSALSHPVCIQKQKAFYLAFKHLHMSVN
jgi:hypothetical protein